MGTDIDFQVIVGVSADVANLAGASRLLEHFTAMCWDNDDTAEYFSGFAVGSKWEYRGGGSPVAADLNAEAIEAAFARFRAATSTLTEAARAALGEPRIIAIVRASC